MRVGFKNCSFKEKPLRNTKLFILKKVFGLNTTYLDPKQNHNNKFWKKICKHLALQILIIQQVVSRHNEAFKRTLLNGTVLQGTDDLKDQIPSLDLKIV